MSELTAKDLHWFRLANSAAPSGFYDFKKRFLKRFAQADGFDLQKIPITCDRCDGSGQYLKDMECRSCGGDGIYRTAEHWLQRWDLAGHVYHVPMYHADVYHLHGYRYPEPKNEIEGRIQHAPTDHEVARRAYWRLLLRHEPVNFYGEIVHLIKWRGRDLSYRLHFKLIKLRNKLDLFPAAPETQDDVPF